MNERNFYHYAPKYDKFYHITCQIILQGSDFFDNRNYDHGFFHKINPTANYYIKCEILPHSLIVNMLNKTKYGINIEINNLERKELTLHQKFDLEQGLKQILPSLLTQNHIPNREIRMNFDPNLNPPYGHNPQIISIADSQTNFDNGFPQQIGVGYTNNVANSQQGNFNSIPVIPQQIPNSFCGNIGNNVMTTQAVSITDSQSNCFLQPINPLSASVAPQNRVTHNVTNSQQQIDFNNIPQHITDRDLRLTYYDGNINSFHGNIVNNTLEIQSVLTTDINHGNDSQNVNGTRNFAYTCQQVDLNNNYRDTDSHGKSTRNNVMTTQAIGLTYDYQDINDIHQVTQSQQQVDFNNNCGNLDSYNENIENNVTTTQANGLTCDHQDINDIHQANHHINVNYRDTDSHNENIENNVTTTQTNDLTCDQDINDLHQVNHINNNYEDTDSHNSNIGNNVITTQTNAIAKM